MPRRLEVTLPRAPTCSALGRQAADEYATVVGPRRLYELKLLITELLNNAYFHGAGEIVLRLSSDERCIRIEVIDEGEAAAIQIRPKTDQTGGHGLRLVDALSEAWGTVDGASHVWADVPLE